MCCAEQLCYNNEGGEQVVCFCVLEARMLYGCVLLTSNIQVQDVTPRFNEDYSLLLSEINKSYNWMAVFTFFDV